MDLSQSDWKYVAERADAFVGREWVFARVRSFLSGPPGTFLLRGDPGTGKTAVAARLAQASCGRLDAADSLPPLIGEGAISAGVFCRAGKVTLSELAQRLSDQLAASVDGFADSLRATAGVERGITIRDVSAVVKGDVTGGTVSGVTVMLPRQDGRLAFSMGVAVPLRHLRERGAAQPIVILVDAVDEAVDVGAVDVGEVNAFAWLLGKLDGVHLIVTCRPDPPVLSNFRAAAHKVDLIADAPADDDDARSYVRNRLTRQGPEEAVTILADRISGEADGNFLYAFYVTGTLIGSGSLAGMDEKTAHALPLPTGGLAGVYEDFLDRHIAGNEARWTEALRPVLAPLCVALGDGFTTAQLAAVASRLTGREFPVMEAGDVTRAAGQFLDGPRPAGPFQVYHQSFSRFLTDPGQNPNWPIDLTETNSAVARALIGTVPQGQPGVRDWAAASAYVRRHLAAHAAAAGDLDDLLLDPGFLLTAHPPGLLAVLSEARSQAARQASAAYQRVVHRLADVSEPARDRYLRLAALQTGAAELLLASGTGSGHGTQEPEWFPSWACRRPAVATRVVSELPSTATALAALVTEQGPLAVAGGEFGLHVWNLESGQRLAARPWKVRSVAAGQVGGRSVALAGHNDGSVILYELPSLEVLARNEAAHTGAVQAAAVLAGGSTAATGDLEGTLVLWQLPALEARAIRPKAHTMVRALASAALGGMPLLVSVGDTLERDGNLNLETGLVRAWTVPELQLHGDVETGANLSRFVAAASTPQGCIVAFERGASVEVQLIAADGAITLIGKQESYDKNLLVLEEGNEPQIMVCGTSLALLQIALRPAPVLALGARVEVERYDACWAGPVDLSDRPFLVSATSTLRAWDLGEVLAALQQGTLTHDEGEHAVSALTVADDVLAALTHSGSVRRWRWRSGEEMEPLAVRSEPIATLASCMLAGQSHFAIAYSDGIVEAFDASSGERWPTRIEIGAALQTMAIGKHAGRTVAAIAVQLGVEPSSWDEGSPFYGVRLWDLTTGTEIPTRSPDGILADRRLRGQNPDDDPYTWKLTIGGYADKPLQNLVAVETADDLFIAASIYERLEVWPLNATDSGFAVREGNWMGFRLLTGRDGLLATVHDHGQCDLLHLGNGANEKSSGEFPGVAALRIGSWQGTPALVSGGEDGRLRVWSQGGAPLLDIDVGEPVTALAFLPEDSIAVGTGRGVLVFQVAGAKVPRMGPIEAKLAELRVAVREHLIFYWDWKSWRDGVFPPATPEFHHSPAREIAELLAESPSQTFRGLSSWLEDDTPLSSAPGFKVADVACTLMGSYSHVAFDELCDVLADMPGTVGGESMTPFRLLQALMAIAPEAGASVCERWSAQDAGHAQLATACAHRLLWRDPSAELRARLLAIESRILNGDPTPLARTEALHALADWPETRDQVIGELIDRFRGRAEGHANAWTLSEALATHFDLVLEAFRHRLMRKPAKDDSEHSLSALARYVPATDTEAEKILDLYQQLGEAGAGESTEEIVSSLMKLAEHPSSSRARAVTVAIGIARTSNGSTARETLAQALFTGNYDSEFRQQTLDAIIRSADPMMKEALVAKLAQVIKNSASRARLGGSLGRQAESPDATLFEAVLRAGADGLETNAVKLILAARESGSFATVLAQVVTQTATEPGGLLAIFAEQAASHADPRTAARQAFDIHRNRHSKSP
jgi:WD40 repeat protein